MMYHFPLSQIFDMYGCILSATLVGNLRKFTHLSYLLQGVQGPSGPPGDKGIAGVLV